MKEILPRFFIMYVSVCVCVHFYVCVGVTSSNASFKMHYENMNANGGTCILNCLWLHVHCIKMIYKSQCVTCTEYSNSVDVYTHAHTCTHTHAHSQSFVLILDFSCNVQLIDNFC